MRLKKNMLFPMAMLAFFLIGLPLGSYYYLKRGYNYRLAALQALDNDFGKLPEFTIVGPEGEAISSSALNGGLVVVNFFPEGDENLKAKLGDYLYRLHDQFDDRNEVAFVTHLRDSAQAEAFLQKYELTDKEQCFFVPGGKDFPAKYAHEGLPDWKGQTIYPYFLLADSSLTIRNFYDMRQDTSIKRLVEHMAMIIPRKPERDIIFKRETEK